jgi:uncharacterized membrane protein
MILLWGIFIVQKFETLLITKNKKTWLNLKLVTNFDAVFINVKHTNMTFPNVILVTTVTCAALMAGLFYSYSCSVVLALRSLPDTNYIMAMQSINKAIQNPIFFIGFLGTLLLLPFNTYLNYSQPIPVKFWLFLAATILYLLGVFCVTVFGNIPLNNALEKFNLLNASGEAIKLQRTSFEERWNNLNTIRTFASILSLILLIIGCINSDKSQLAFSK